MFVNLKEYEATGLSIGQIPIGRAFEQAGGEERYLKLSASTYMSLSGAGIIVTDPRFMMESGAKYRLFPTGTVIIITT